MATGGTTDVQLAARVEVDDSAVPFGRYRLSPLRERVRRSASAFPRNRAGRWMASFARRLSMAGLAEPFDLEVFPGEYARLYPRQSLCEKRAFATPQYFDAVEREHLAAAIAAFAGDRPFVFVDAGANVGLYSLYARSAARRLGRDVLILAIEPDPINAGRLAFNLSRAAFGGARMAQVALGREAGEARLAVPAHNRGEIRIDAGTDGDGPMVATVPLAALLERHGIELVDALKIDIEGHEFEVLEAYFAAVPAERWPALIMMEIGEGEATAAYRLCLRMGYEPQARTRQNAILRCPRNGGRQD